MLVGEREVPLCTRCFQVSEGLKLGGSGLSARVCIPGSTVSGLVTLGELPDCFVLHAFIHKFGIIIVCAV